LRASITNECYAYLFGFVTCSPRPHARIPFHSAITNICSQAAGKNITFTLLNTSKRLSPPPTPSLFLYVFFYHKFSSPFLFNRHILAPLYNRARLGRGPKWDIAHTAAMSWGQLLLSCDELLNKRCLETLNMYLASQAFLKLLSSVKEISSSTWRKH